MRFLSVLLVCLVCLLLGQPGGADSKPTTTKTIKPFTLEDSKGDKVSFADFKEKKAIVVLFLGTECPINNQYLPMLAKMHETYSAKDVAFLGINSNLQDTPAKILAHVKTNKIPFPVLRDSANVVADDFAARRTPEAFVVSPGGQILYQGRIDDQIGIGFRRKEPTKKDLMVALDEVLAGKKVTTPLTDAPGCLIARSKKPKEEGKITYHKDIAKILQARCQECHRSGQVGPMSLTSYEDALSWQAMIQEVVSDGRMPPWHADPKHGEWSNDRSLSKEEKQTILDWIEGGCVKGDPKDAPEEKKWPSDWHIGKPDHIFKMPTKFTVPAEAPKEGVPYKYFRIPTNYAEDMWIEAAEARPGAREVVHHIILYIVDAKTGRRPGSGTDGIGNGFLVSYAPGDSPLILKPGMAKRLPKGALLVFQMHYTPDGVEREDQSSVAIRFAKKPPEIEVKTRAIAQRLFAIPPGAENHDVHSRSTFKEDTEIISLFPHMHVRGKAFKYDLVHADNKRETILNVPKYDFNWQSNYMPQKPIKIPAGARIECKAIFDNSDKNPNNPNPKKLVIWGEQTWEEMMIGFVDYTIPLKKAE
jgi:peroxiredoxin